MFNGESVEKWIPLTGVNRTMRKREMLTSYCPYRSRQNTRGEKRKGRDRVEREEEKKREKKKGRDREGDRQRHRKNATHN